MSDIFKSKSVQIADQFMEFYYYIYAESKAVSLISHTGIPVGYFLPFWKKYSASMVFSDQVIFKKVRPFRNTQLKIFCPWNIQIDN